MWKTCKYLKLLPFFISFFAQRRVEVNSKITAFLQTSMKPLVLWKTVLSDLEVSVSHGNFMTWIKPTKITRVQKLDVGSQLVEISCPSAYHKQYLEERYQGQLKEALDRITKQNNNLTFTVSDSPSSEPTLETNNGPLFQVNQTSKSSQYREAVLQVRLREDFTFQTFAVSSSNEMAHAAAQAIAKSPGKAYNPFFIYGGVGVGKTHLIQAIANRVLKQNPEVSIIYCSGEEFTNGIIGAIQQKKTHAFKKRYRGARLLLIDDVQFIAGKVTVQEEFFYTFNAVQREGGQIILVSDQPPHEIDGLEARLRSRFEGGLTIDVQQPNFELRTAILLIKSKTLNVSLPMEVAQLIAANIESTRLLEGFLTRIVTEAKLRKQKLSQELVRSLLGQVKESNVSSQPLIRPKDVMGVITRHFNISSSLLSGPVRKKQVVFSRHIAMYLLRIELHLAFEEIGDIFGGRDHTTVMYAVDKITKDLSTSENTRFEVESLRKKLYNHH